MNTRLYWRTDNRPNINIKQNDIDKWKYKETIKREKNCCYSINIRGKVHIFLCIAQWKL